MKTITTTAFEYDESGRIVKQIVTYEESAPTEKDREYPEGYRLIP